MAQEKAATYTVGFRLSAEVELTEAELIALVKGDSSVVKKKLDAHEVTLGGGDSYVPGSWLSDSDIPDEVKARVLTECNMVNFDDIDLDV